MIWSYLQTAVSHNILTVFNYEGHGTTTGGLVDGLRV